MAICLSGGGGEKPRIDHEGRERDISHFRSEQNGCLLGSSKLTSWICKIIGEEIRVGYSEDSYVVAVVIHRASEIGGGIRDGAQRVKLPSVTTFSNALFTSSREFAVVISLLCSRALKHRLYN